MELNIVKQHTLVKGDAIKPIWIIFPSSISITSSATYLPIQDVMISYVMRDMLSTNTGKNFPKKTANLMHGYQDYITLSN